MSEQREPRIYWTVTRQPDPANKIPGEMTLTVHKDDYDALVKSRAEAPSRDALWANVEEAIDEHTEANRSWTLGFSKARTRATEARTALVAAIRKWGER